MRKLSEGIWRNTSEGQGEKFGFDKICNREPLEVLEHGNDVQN